MFRSIKESILSKISGYQGEQTSYERLTLKSLDLNSHLLAREVFQYVQDRDPSTPITLAILLSLESERISDRITTPDDMPGTHFPKVRVENRRFKNPFYLRPGRSISIQHDYYPLEKDAIPFFHTITITHHKNGPDDITQHYFFKPKLDGLEEVREKDVDLSGKTIFKSDLIFIYPWDTSELSPFHIHRRNSVTLGNR